MPDTPVGDGTANYLLTSADLDATIYCKVTATNASGTANADSNTVGPVTAAAGAYTGPGDVVAGATGYWGLRGYNASYTGPALDLHNTSTGAFVATINILSTGALDVATAATHIGAGAAKVGKLYDQIGSIHFEQATNANRPILVLNAVGTRPALLFTTTQGFISIDVTVTRAQPFTGSFYFKSTTFGGQNLVSVASGLKIQADWGTSVAGFIDPLMNAGADIFTTIPSNVWHAIQAKFSGASSDLNIDGTANTGDAGTGGIVSEGIELGTNSGSPGGLIGYLTEMGIWPSAFSGANSSAMYANQAAWWV